MGQWIWKDCVLRERGILWERQACEAAIDSQRDRGQESGWLLAEKPQLCEGLVGRALIEKKHPREKCGKPRPLIRVLRACAGGQEPRDCRLCSTAEVGSAGADTLKTHFRCCGRQ